MFEIIKNSIYEVNSELGNYYKENIYQSALASELQLKNVIIQTEVIIPIIYKNINVGYERADIVIYNSDKIYSIIELKSQTTRISSKEINQLRKYLINLNCDCGILVNFYDTLEFYLVDKFSHRKICNDTSCL